MSLFNIAVGVDNILPSLDQLWENITQTIVDDILAPMWHDLGNVGEAAWDTWKDVNSLITWTAGFTFDSVLERIGNVELFQETNFGDILAQFLPITDQLGLIDAYLSQNLEVGSLKQVSDNVLSMWQNQGDSTGWLLNAINSLDLSPDIDFTDLKASLQGSFHGALGGLQLDVFKGLSDLPLGFISGIVERSEGLLGKVTTWLEENLSELMNTLEGILQPVIEKGLGLFTDNFSMDSPDPQLLALTQKFAETMFTRVEGIADTERKSFPPWANVRTNALLYSGLTTAAIAALQGLGIFADATHIFKAWGFREGFADLVAMVMPQMGLGTVLQMPFEIGTLRFVEMHLMEQHRPSLPAVGDLISMFQRGKLTEVQLYEYLGFHGFQEEFVWGYVELAKSIPAPQELVQFLVKEVVTPAQFTALVGKHGFSPEIADMFWDSHWNLPGVGQVMEMYHRQLNFPLITLDEDGTRRITYPTDDKSREEALDGYLKIADYAEEWRPFIRDISYNVITRVDARRGWEMGELVDTDLHKIYRDAGYSPTDAIKLTEIQKYATLEAERGERMRRSQDLYTEGWINREELTALLGSFMKNETMIEYRVRAAETERDLNNRADWVSINIQQYRKDTIDITVLQSRLEALDMEQWRILSIVGKEQARKGLEVEQR